MKKNLKKLTALILATAACTAGLSGCGGSKPAPDASSSAAPESAPTSSTAPAAPEKAGGSLTLMASQNWIKDIDRELFKKFQEETGTEVKVLVTPDNGYETLLGTSLAGGSNAVDMFMYQAGTPMVSAGIPDVALDLSAESWAANLEDWAKTANSKDGKLYGFSTWGIDYEGVLYNKTYFEENNLKVPETWTDFVALCDQIVGLGKIPLYESINGVWHTQTWFYGAAPAFSQDIPDFVDQLNASKDYKLSDNAKAVEALAQIRDFLSAKEGGKPKYFTNDGQSEDWFGSYPALTNRDNVMMLTYTAYPAELAAKGSKDEWGMFPLPVLDNKTTISNGGGISKYINKNSQNIDACKALLNFLAKQENLDAYYAARADLVTASFKNVATVNPTAATTEILERSTKPIPTMLMRDMLYWDPDLYKYFQGFSDGTVTPEQFLKNMDDYRATMFDAAAA